MLWGSRMGSLSSGELRRYFLRRAFRSRKREEEMVERAMQRQKVLAAWFAERGETGKDMNE